MSLIMDFTTTAMPRPHIVDKTFKSFNKHLKGINLRDCRLFINVDPAPTGVKRKLVTKVGQKYFGEVISNYPEEPNYAAAYKWVWSHADTKFIFNLEDDWTLSVDVDVPKLLEYFNVHKKLYIVALRAYKYKYMSCPTSPGIMHQRYYKKLGENLQTNINPEAQLRGEKWGLKMPSVGHKIAPKGRVVVYPENIKKVIVHDIGRHWAKNQGFKKGGGGKKAHFIAWETTK